MVCSWGRRAVSARSTVSPPTPLSNTPMGASAFTDRSVSRRGFGAHHYVRDQAGLEEVRRRAMGPVDEVEGVAHRAQAEDRERMDPSRQWLDEGALGAHGAARHRARVGAPG